VEGEGRVRIDKEEKPAYNGRMNADRQRDGAITYARIQATLDSFNNKLPPEVRRHPIYPMEEIERIYDSRWEECCKEQSLLEDILIRQEL
jgi:hypothetical protein